MNKIVVAKEKLAVENVKAYLDIKNDNLTINCKGQNLLVIKNKVKLNLNIMMEDNSFLDILIYNRYRRGENAVKITQNNNTTINYYEAFTSNNDYLLSLKNILKGDNNKSNIKIRCLSNNQKVQINVLADAYKGTKNNDITEDIKGLNNGGKIMVQPNMEINTHDILANHFVTIGSIRKDNLFYLESQGINESTAKKIIGEGFLKGIFSQYQNILFGGEDNE